VITCVMVRRTRAPDPTAAAGGASLATAVASSIRTAPPR
jgi:hypothetical protein